MPGAGFVTFDLRYRLSPAGPWTTLSGLPVVDTMGLHTFPAGTFSVGNTYDMAARVTDTDGDVGDWGTITFMAVEPPAAPVILEPDFGDEVTSSPVTIDWTVPLPNTQDAYHLILVGEDGHVIYDEVVASSTSLAAIDWTGLASQQVSATLYYTDPAVGDDIWSGAAVVIFTVNIDPPGAPIVTGQVDNTLGKVDFEIQCVDTPFPTVTIDVFRTDVTHNEEEILVASGLIPDATTRRVSWTDYTPANRTLYRYRFKANSAAGGFAFDAGVGGGGPTAHTVTIRPSPGGSIIHSGGGGVTASIVGTSPLSDDTDATYVRFHDVESGARDLINLPIPATPVFTAAQVTSIELHIRAQTTDSVGGTAKVEVDLSTGTGGTGFAGSFGPAPADVVTITRDGTIADLVVVLTPESETGITLEQTAQMLVDGGFMQIYPTDLNLGWEVTVYEVSIVVGYLA
jgi:hypothetical protein